MGALWKLSVPSKLKVFVWRLAQQSFPSTDFLHHQNMAMTSVLHFVVLNILGATLSFTVGSMSQCVRDLLHQERMEHLGSNLEYNAKN